MPRKVTLTPGQPPKPRGRPKLTAEKRRENQVAKQTLIQADPVSAVTEPMRQALFLLADGASVQEAAEQAGYTVQSLRNTLCKPHVRAARRRIQDLHMEGYRETARHKLFEMAGLVKGIEGAEDENVRLKAITTVLALMGDSERCAYLKLTHQLRRELEDAGRQKEAEALAAAVKQASAAGNEDTNGDTDDEGEENGGCGVRPDPTPVIMPPTLLVRIETVERNEPKPVVIEHDPCS